jgi:hypothetical protein
MMKGRYQVGGLAVLVGALTAAGCPWAGGEGGHASAVEFTQVPEYATTDALKGRVQNVAPDEHCVAVYIFVSGWWTKPTFADPVVPIDDDGTWQCNITTGGHDALATEIAAFVLPEGVAPPRASGEPELPKDLAELAVASVQTSRPPYLRTVTFSEYEWGVKLAPMPIGPGPNLFSDADDQVWVDEDGRLHLGLRKRDGKWHCSEVVCLESLGYGTYAFEVEGDLTAFDPHLVLGLFTWDDAPDFHHREIDVEIGTWGEPEDSNAQFVVQPYDRPGGTNIHRFDVGSEHVLTTHSYRWEPGRVTFRSASQAGANEAETPGTLATWECDGPDVPEAGNESPRINLWLLHGEPPLDDSEAEIVVRRLEFTPLQGAEG